MRVEFIVAICILGMFSTVQWMRAEWKIKNLLSWVEIGWQAFYQAKDAWIKAERELEAKLQEGGEKENDN